MPKLVVIRGPLKGQVFDLGSKEVIFCGRSPKMNDMAILEMAVSRKHFKMFKIGRDFFIEDLNSKHGTLVNGKTIEPGEGFQVGEGDYIAVGNTVMQFTDLEEEGSLRKSVPAAENFLSDSPSGEEARKDRRSAKELELVYNVSELLKKQMDMDSFFKEFLTLILGALPRIDSASIFLSYNSRNNYKNMIEVVPDSHEKTASRYKKDIVESVVQEKKTVRISNTEFELPQSYIEKGDTIEIKSAMCVPIISGDDVLGTIYIESVKPYGFRKSDQFLLNSLVGSLAIAIEKYRLTGKTPPAKNNPNLFRDKIINMIRRS